MSFKGTHKGTLEGTLKRTLKRNLQKPRIWGFEVKEGSGFGLSAARRPF